MTGEIKIFKKGCSVTITTTAASVATVTGVEHHFVSNGQIKVGQQISFSGYTGSAKVNAVEDVVYSNNRRTKVTLDTSTTINNTTSVTFTSLDNTFNTDGRVGDVTTFTITIERNIGRILSPNPIIDFTDVDSMNNYKVVTTDVYENTTELIKRTFVITHRVGLKKLKRNDVVNIKALTIVDVTGSNNKIYGYELLAKPPGQTIEQLSNTVANSNIDLTSISFPTARNINKRAETRLLVVFGDPGATFQLGVLSNVVTVNHESSAVTNQTTLNLNGSANGTVVNKDMTITAMGGGTAITAGVKVVSVTDASPDTITLNLGQSAASTELISFGHVLVAASTVKTIGTNGIYTEYIDFPENNSTADITFTITLTENTTGSFTGFATPSTLAVKSLHELLLNPAYTSATTQATPAWHQIAVLQNPTSTGSGTVLHGVGNAETVNTNLGA